MLLEIQSKPVSYLATEFKKEEEYIQELEKKNAMLQEELFEEKKKNREKNQRIAKLSSRVKEI